MKNKAIYIKFIVITILSGLVGGVAGFCIGGNEESIKKVSAEVGTYLMKNAGKFQVIVGAVMMTITVVMIIIRYTRFRNLEENEDLLDGFESHCDRIMEVNSIHMVLQFILYGMYINDVGDKEIFFYIFWFLGMIVFITATEVYVIAQIKKYNPIKKGNPFDFHFRKQWMNSSDEAERYIVYAASYHSYCLMSMTLRVMAIVLMLCNLAVNIGALPFIVLGVLWIMQISSYFFWVKRLSGQKIND